MKLFPVLLLIAIWGKIEAQVNNHFLNFGFDYRQYPIDIENVPRGGSTSNGLPDDGSFWQTISLKCGYSINLKKNLSIAFSGYIRRNHNNYLQGKNITITPPLQRKEKKKTKYDFFLDLEKRIPIKKKGRSYISIKAGFGVTNMNTGFNVFLQDTLPSGVTQGFRYVGSYTHTGPRVNIGYQYKNWLTSIDTYLVEGPDLNNLSSLWIGLSLSYEICLIRKQQRKP